jgi:two-component system response regulator HydG
MMNGCEQAKNNTRINSGELQQGSDRIMTRPVEILVVDDELIVRESLIGWLKKAGHKVEAAEGGYRALEMLKSRDYELMFLDLKMPDLSGLEVLKEIKASRPQTMVVMITAYGSVETAVEAMKCGANDYLLKPFEPEQLTLLVEKMFQQKRIIDENVQLRDELATRIRCQDLIGKSSCMQRLFSLIEEVAGVDSAILLRGETGTGKELIAKAIHAKSGRRYGPFIPINCGAFSEHLLESELFGHEVGSFTGATRAKKGRIEMAANGTLFLDEIGEIPPKMQVDLLRVLEEKRLHRVGGNRDIPVDFRLVSATHRDLGREMERGSFRQDLFFRLNVIEIEVAPLRSRKEDIPLLAGSFLERFRRETNKPVEGIREDGLMLLQSYDWPGNVRELENAIERAVVLAKSSHLRKEDFAFLFRATGQPFPQSLEAAERNHIERILKLCQWNISKAASILEINRTTLHNKINKYELKRSD